MSLKEEANTGPLNRDNQNKLMSKQTNLRHQAELDAFYDLSSQGRIKT